MVAVGLVGDALGRAEVHAAGQGLAGGVVDDAGVDPVAALLSEAEAQACGGVDGCAAFKVREASCAQFVVAAGDVDLGGGDAGDFGVGGAVGFVAGLAEAGGVGGEEFGGVAGDGMREGGDAAFDGDLEVEGGVGVVGLRELDDDRTAGGTAEGVFVDVAKAEAAKNDAAVGGAYLDGLDGDVGSGVAPGPEVERVGGDATGDLGEGPAHLAAFGGVAWDELVVHVGHRKEGRAGGANVGDQVLCGDEPADFEAFADGELGLPAVGVVDDVGGDVVAGDAAAVEMGVDEDVGEDEGVGGLADGNGDGLGVAAVAEEG